MIRRKLTSVLIAVFAGVILCGVAAFGQNLSNLKVTPGVGSTPTDGTANSVYTVEVTWTDPSNRYPSGEPVTLPAHPVTIWSELVSAEPSHFYRGEEATVSIGADENDLRIDIRKGTPEQAGPVQEGGVIGVWKSLSDIDNPERNLVRASQPLDPDDHFIIQLDKEKCDQEGVADGSVVYAVFYGLGDAFPRECVKLSTTPNEVRGVWDNAQGTGTNYYEPGGRIDATYGHIVLPNPVPDDVLNVYVSYGVYDLTKVRFNTFWMLARDGRNGIRSVVSSQDRTKDLYGGIIDQSGTWYTVALLEALERWPETGVEVNLVYRGYRTCEPVECQRPSRPTSYDPYRTRKMTWLGRTRSAGGSGQVPVIRGGLIGVFDSPNPNPSIDTNYAAGFDRHTGTITLIDSAEYGKVYWACYMRGPVTATIAGQTVCMAEKDEVTPPIEGVVYYVRVSAGLDLANRSDGVPGVNYHGGLVYRGIEPVEPYRVTVCATPPVEGSGELATSCVQGDLIKVHDTHSTRLSNGSYGSGYVNEHDVDDLSGKSVVVPYNLNVVDGIYALKVDWDNNGYVKVDWRTNYWTGGSFTNETPTKSTIYPGTAVIRTEQIPVNAYAANGQTTITLPLGYCEVIKSSSHFIGVYLDKDANFNYYSGGSYTAGDLWQNQPPVIRLGTPLPRDQHFVWIKYIPRVMVKCMPTHVINLVSTGGSVPTDPTAYTFTRQAIKERYGSVRSGRVTGLMSHAGSITPLDPLVVELPTTTAGRPPSTDPSDPTQTVVPRHNPLDPANPIIWTEDQNHPDDGTSSSAYTFKIRYEYIQGLRPWAWMPNNVTPIIAPSYLDDVHTGGVVLYLDEKGYGDYKPYFMAKFDPLDYSYEPIEGGCWYVFRVEPTYFLFSDYVGPVALPMPFMVANLYRSLTLGQYHYFFGASADYIRDENGALLLNERVWVDSDPDIFAIDGLAYWTEPKPYDPYIRNGSNEVNCYNYVDRPGYSPGDTDLYGRDAKGNGLQNSSEHPIVHPQLEPPIPITGTEVPEFVGGGEFLGTLTPFYSMTNPAYAYPSHGHTWGFIHNHWGYWTVTPGLWHTGMASSGSTTATEHTFRIKYKSKDPITGKGIAPNGVWVYINNASSAGNAGRTTIEIARKTPPSSPYTYIGYPMQPKAGDPLDYANGVIYEATGITLPAGPHTYYFEASDGFGVARYPVRPDGRWQYGKMPPEDDRELAVFWEDPYVPGDHDYADNNDFCPGPYVNNKPRLANAKVTPNSGSQGSDFVFSVTYYDIDGDVETIPPTNPGTDWGGPIYKGQRPYKAELIIEINPKTKETRRVSMTKADPYDVNYMDGCEYIFDTHSMADLAFTPGEHRFYFEFIDDWGLPTDPNDRRAGEKVRYPEGEDTWIIGPVIMESSAPTLSDGTVESTDGTANSATLWKFGVNYADANNEAPTYVNMYVGEEIRKLATLERTTPVMDANGQYSSIRAANCSIKQVVGIYDNPEGTGTNYYEANGGSIDPKLNGIIKLATPLADGKDVYVTYYYDTLEWDAGHEMIKANPSDIVYSDGARYEVNLRLGGSRKQLLDSTQLTIIPDSQGLRTGIQVDPNVVRSIIGIYDNEEMEGINYWTGQVVNELYTNYDANPNNDIAGYNPATGTAAITLMHKPIAADAVINVYGNPRGTGTNYFDPNNVDRANGIIGLRGIPLKPGSTTEPAVTEFYVSYSTPPARYDTESGVIALSTPLLMDKPFVFFSNLPRAYYFAFEASDGQEAAVYNTAIDPVTLQDSRWAEAIVSREYTKKEVLAVVEPGRQYAPKFMGNKSQYVEPGQVLLGGLPYSQTVNDKDILSDPVLYRSEEKLIQQYEDVANLASTGDETGKSIQLDLLTVSGQPAWRIDENQVQLRMGPIPDPSRNPNPIISVVDYSDGQTRYYQPDGSVDHYTGVVTLSNAPVPPKPVPATETKVLATYRIWGIFDSETGKINGVDDILAIYDNVELSGFDYWSGYADVEPVSVERKAGSQVSIKVAHTPIRRVIGVWDNPSKTGVNYFDANDAQAYDSSTGIVKLINVPSTVSQVYVTYYTEPSTYDRGIGKVTLGSILPEGKRSVWIKYRQHADYRVNLLGDASKGVQPTFIFDYHMPGDQSDPMAAVRADYWFGRRIAQNLGYNTPPKLSNGKLTPITGTSTMNYVFMVDYSDNDGPNGQPPSYVRVVIDGIPYDMIPVVSGTPAYNAGATFRYSTALSTGAHKYHFEASDGEGFAFLGYYGSTPTKIVDIPGPWVNDNPILSDGSSLPNPTDAALSMLESVDFFVTYTDRDNDAPDAGNPWCWIDYGKTARPGETITPHYGVVDDIIREDGTSVVTNSESQARARKIYFDLDVHKSDSDPLIAREAATGWYIDQFAGKYLQMISGKSKGRVYQIAYNYADTITVTDEDILSDSIEKGDKFIIGPVGMAKVDPSQMDHTNGVVYKVTIPRMTPSETGHTYHFETTTTAWMPKHIGDSFKPPLTDEQRKIVQSARFPTPTGELQTARVVANVPSGNRAPELEIPEDGKFLDAPNPPVAGGAYTFYVKYRDFDGDAPSWRTDAPVLGYIRVVFDDGSFAEDMLPVAGQTSTYATGLVYSVTSTKVSPGTHKFHFEASDGWRTVRLDDPRFVVTVNGRPQITVGEDGVTPPAGNIGTQFVFNATIKDSDGWPNGAWVMLTIQDPNDHTKKIQVNGNQMTKTGTDYINTGVVYSWTLKPSDYPSIFGRSESYTYEYIWEASDGTDAAVPVTKSGPTVNPNLAAPKLRFPTDIEGKPMPVDPMRGTLSQNYTFQVIYSDEDGDAPVLPGSVEGVSLVINGKSPIYLKPARAKGAKPDYKAGEMYTVTLQGKSLPDITSGVKTGTHSLQFSARDDLNTETGHLVVLSAQGPTIEQSDVSLTPDATVYALGSAATITGQISPVVSQASVTIKVQRPNGSGFAETIQTDSQGAFQFKFDAIPIPDRKGERSSKTLDITGKWNITATWAGTATTGQASTSTSFTVCCPSPYDRYILVTDGAGIPLKDMISSPLYDVGVHVTAMWESNKVYWMDISRFDPDSGQWLIKELLAPFTGGEAFKFTVISPENFPKDDDGLMSLSPLGRLWYQDSPFAINLRAGWNMIGSVFLRPIAWSNCKVLYNNEMSLAQAAAAGIVYDYAWKWDARVQDFKLVHAENANALKTLDPYGAYWVYASVDCQLILDPGVRARTRTTAATTNASEASAVASTTRNLETPPAP